MEDIFLTPALKTYYMQDFTKNVLTCGDDFWKLDADLKDSLVAINANPRIQTLYSKRHNQQKRINSGESYIVFAYAQEAEQQIFKQLLPEITAKHCWSEGFDETTCYYTFTYPTPNGNEPAGDFAMACTTDKDYFNISRIRIYLVSNSIDKHREFWDDVTAALSAI